jgi:hypothetical protein
MPSEQKILTELAWDAVRQARHDKHRTPVFYNYALGTLGFVTLSYPTMVPRYRCPNSYGLWITIRIQLKLLPSVNSDCSFDKYFYY